MGVMNFFLFFFFVLFLVFFFFFSSEGSFCDVFFYLPSSRSFSLRIMT